MNWGDADDGRGGLKGRANHPEEGHQASQRPEDQDTVEQGMPDVARPDCCTCGASNRRTWESFDHKGTRSYGDDTMNHSVTRG
jgi:predicted P-loop ATPase